MITFKDGRTLDGTPLQVVKAMKSMAFNGRGSLSEYIDWVVANALQYDSVDLKVTGETDEERAESLLDEMVRTGLAERS